MSAHPSTQHPLQTRVVELREALSQRGMQAIARRLGPQIQIEGNTIQLPFWHSAVHIHFPEVIAVNPGDGQPLSVLDQAMLVYYLHDSDGTPPAGQWIAFTELPAGRFYTQAFQGYTGEKLARHFGEDISTLEHCACHIHGRYERLASAAFAFDALPCVPLLLAVWLGDEDFPTSYRILFDAHVPHHLSTDSCAILGSMLTARLINALQSIKS